MENITRRQHHVWRYYLEAWAKNDQIFCRQDNKIFYTNLTNIAVINDFYKFNALTEMDMKHLEYFISKIIPELKDIDNYIINTFISLLKLKKRDDISSEEMYKQSKILQITFEEKLNTEIENNSIKYIDCLRSSDFSFYNNEKDKLEFNVFISAQYFRTRKFKEIYTKLFNNTQYGNSENLVNIIRQIFIVNYSYNMTINNYKIELISNNSEYPLITGDQPVVNILGDGVNIPKDTILYYPISPKIAILLYQNDAIIDKILDKEKILYYNNKIISNSVKQIFSNNRESLDVTL
ncbi:MAG: hypothetical protein Ta2G_10010 [Termitinemataceae bacterium]|nr:MAG: hypothetical protein Ta2G_10010 [Termitinemataceae bacterium]